MRIPKSSGMSFHNYPAGISFINNTRKITVMNNKTKVQLIDELNELRKRIAELEVEKKERKPPKYEYQFGNKNFDEITFFSIVQKIINIFHYFIIIVDEDHNILLANDKVLNALGKNIEDIVGQYCPKIVHGIDESFPGCPLEEAIEKGHYIEKDLLDPFYKKWVYSAIYPMNCKTQDGKKIFFHIARDITDSKLAEETIHQQNEFLKNILESLTQPFYIINANDYTVIMANSAANFGNLTKNSKCYKLTHNRNKPCKSIEHPCPIKEIIKTKKPYIVEHNHYTKDGKVLQFEVHCYPIIDSDGKITKIIEYTIDITERKRAEKKLKKTQKELEIKSKNLEEKNIALRVILDHQNEEKKNLYRDIFKNIKNLVYPNLENLKVSSLTENQKTLVNIIESNLSKVIKPFSTLLISESINLSPSEVRVANMIKEGKIAKEIATIMYISGNTVKAHCRNIRSKLQIKNKKINLRTHLQSLEELVWLKKL